MSSPHARGGPQDPPKQSAAEPSEQLASRPGFGVSDLLAQPSSDNPFLSASLDKDADGAEPRADAWPTGAAPLPSMIWDHSFCSSEASAGAAPPHVASSLVVEEKLPASSSAQVDEMEAKYCGHFEADDWAPRCDSARRAHAGSVEPKLPAERPAATVLEGSVAAAEVQKAQPPHPEATQRVTLLRSAEEAQLRGMSPDAWYVYIQVLDGPAFAAFVPRTFARSSLSALLLSMQDAAPHLSRRALTESDIIVVPLGREPRRLSRPCASRDSMTLSEFGEVPCVALVLTPART